MTCGMFLTVPLQHCIRVPWEAGMSQETFFSKVYFFAKIRWGDQTSVLRWSIWSKNTSQIAGMLIVQFSWKNGVEPFGVRMVSLGGAKSRGSLRYKFFPGRWPIVIILYVSKILQKSRWRFPPKVVSCKFFKDVDNSPKKSDAFFLLFPSLL